VPRHVARLVTRLVVDYFTSAARPVASARRAARRVARRQLLCLRRVSSCLGTSRGLSLGSSSTTSPPPRVWVSRHVARLVTQLVAWLVAPLVVGYSVRCDFVLQPRWLYFSHAMRGDYLSRGNTGSTSSMLHAATTSSSGRIASTIHFD
jgi:hypothetical protein